MEIKFIDDDIHIRYKCKSSIHEILMNTLNELCMTSIQDGEIYDVSHCALSFDSFMINDENITYYNNGQEIHLSDKDVLNEIYEE